jgi:HlyD family secretion protein
MAAQRLKMFELGPRIESIEESNAEVGKLTADLQLIERGTRAEELDQLSAQTDEVRARIQEVQANLAESIIHAPSECLVEVVTVRPGDMAAPNQPVIRVRRPDDIWIKAYVPETQLPRIKLNQSVRIAHDGSRKAYEGTIFHIASAGEFTPRNVQSATERQNQVFAIKIRVLDEQNVFKSGMATEVHIPTSPSAIDN